MSDIIVDFKATAERLVFNSEDFKIYGCSINSFEYPNIYVGKYGTCTIKGNIQELNLGTEYIIKAKEIVDKYGTGYEVVNIKREKPTSIDNTRQFLYEILTENQANELIREYPNIVDMVMKNKADKVDLSKLRGIGQYTFDVIQRKIIENFKLADLVEEFQGVFSLSIIKKIYDKYPSVEKIRDKIRENPYECLCSMSGIGFKTADDMLLKLERDSKERVKQGKKPILHFGYELIDSYQRAKACVDYLLLENEGNGNTYMHVSDLKKQYEILVPECLRSLPVILKEGSNIVFNRDKLLVATKNAYDTEKYASMRLLEGLNIKSVFDCDFSKYTSLDGFDLTPDQQKTSKYMCENNIVLLIGFAGSGKSSSTQAFVNMLKDYNKSYLLLAPTGRAAKVLSSYTNEDAQTIHRGLGYMPPNTWNYNEDHKLDVDVVIVDEFSMVDIFIFKRLLEAIDFNRTKLLIIGDPSQLASVSAGNVLHDLINCDMIPTITLDKVFRYGIGGLSTVATDIRSGNKYLDDKNDSIQVFGEDKAYTFLPCTQEKSISYLIQIYKKLLSQGYSVEDIGVLTSFNVGDYGTSTINTKLQDEINNNDKFVKYGNAEYRLNDIVINFVNNYKAIVYDEDVQDLDNSENITFIANGDIGIVTKILDNAIVINYDGLLIYCPKSSMNNIGLAYSISTHKSQGGQFKVVILMTPKAHTYMLNSNLLYVGVTRAKEKCIHIGEVRTVNLALKKKENLNRKTMLQMFMK